MGGGQLKFEFSHLTAPPYIWIFGQVGVAWCLLYDTFNILRSRTIQDLLNVNRFNSILFYSTKRKLDCSFYIYVTETWSFHISFYSLSRLLAIPVHFGDKLSDGTIRINNTFYVCRQTTYATSTTLHEMIFNLHRSEVEAAFYAGVG
jgi:hypothetical protein